MKTQIVYTLISSEKDCFLEELWVSLYSLRQFHPEVMVRVLVDEPTKGYMERFPKLCDMITEIIVVPVPEEYNAKQRSREIKTKVRNVIGGAYLFIDTDTVICKPLGEIDNLSCDVAAVPDGHLPLRELMFPPIDSIKNTFGVDVSDSDYWFNSGVMYVADNENTKEFYKAWNKNWTFSCFEKGQSQDQPALSVTNKEFGGLICKMDDRYNAQVAMSLKYFADAAIVHWWHMDFIENQDYSPFFSLQIYKEIKENGGMTPHAEELIKNCKQSFASPTMPIGKEQIYFLFSPAGKIFNRIYRDGGVASFLMNKVAGWLDKVNKVTKNKNGISQKYH